MNQNKQTKFFNPIPYFIVCFFAFTLFNTLLTKQILHNIFLSNDSFKFIDIVYVQNTGAAFSSFQHFTMLLIIISIVAVILLIWELFKDLTKYSIPIYFASSMLLSGIVTNTIERITLGYVRDFISLKFINFPVFNISDILINIGVLVIIILIVTKNYKRKK